MTKVEPLPFLLSPMSPPPHIYNSTVLLFRDLKNGTLMTNLRYRFVSLSSSCARGSLLLCGGESCLVNTNGDIHITQSTQGFNQCIHHKSTNFNIYPLRQGTRSVSCLCFLTNIRHHHISSYIKFCCIFCRSTFIGMMGACET